jgi:hypothetical protein
VDVQSCWLIRAPIPFCYARLRQRGKSVKELIAKLDQPTALPGNVHVVYLKMPRR